MKRGIRLIFLVLALATSFRTYADGEHWSWNMNQYNSNAIFVSVISIDGVVQRSDQLEIGAFYDGECRGSVICVYDARTDYYYAYLTVNGVEGMEITFRLFDHATESELDVTCGLTYTFVKDDFLGMPRDPFVFPFTTNPVERVFNGAVNAFWSVAGNWVGNTLPAEGDIAIIDAVCQLDQDAKVLQLTVNDNQSVTIPNGYTLTADEIVSDAAAKLVVADGGQLVCDNLEGVFATVQKTVEGYGDGNDKWYFIASPLVEGTSHQSVGNLVNEEGYDLYAFDQTEKLEWRNFKNNDLTLNPGEGYLYANQAEITLEFVGELNNGLENVPLEYVEGCSFKGWNLIGNPYTYQVYASQSYYVLDEAGQALKPTPVSQASAIDPCTGLMVMATGEGESVTFNKSPMRVNQGGLWLNVASSIRSEASDCAFVSFSADDALPKFVFKADHPKLYIPQEDTEYAIAVADRQDEVAVNFKAAQEGSYTLSVNISGVDMEYLHLIDNLTGIETDLLATSTYTFKACPADFASRFRLAFNAKEGPDSDFAFYDGGCFIIHNEGEATLQVLDMVGHILLSVDGRTRCVPASGMTPGVYMLRLVHGENVKVQKVVVR